MSATSIKRINNLTEWRETVTFEPKLAVWTFGPLAYMPATGECDEDVIVLVAMDGDATVGYLISDHHGIWCIDVLPAYQRRGVATALVRASGADTLIEPNLASRALAEKLGLYIMD